MLLIQSELIEMFPFEKGTPDEEEIREVLDSVILDKVILLVLAKEQ